MKKTYIGFITILLFVFIFICVKFSEKSTELQILQETYESQLYLQFQKKDSLHLLALYSDGSKFEVAISNTLSQKRIDKAMKGGTKLLFYHSEVNCNSCVELIIKELENFRDSIGVNNILYLSEYKRNRDMLIFKRINQIESELFNISSLNIPIYKMNEPFLFIVDPEGKIRCVFMPNKEDIKNIKLYLSIVRLKYFNNNHKSI